MAGMSADFANLVDVTIRHLEELKTKGTRFVAVDRATLTALRQPPPMRTPVLGTSVAEALPAAESMEASLPHESIPQSSSPVLLPAAPATAALPIAPENAPPTPSATAPPASALRGEAKAQAIAELRERALVCVKCPHLAAVRKHVVFGVGSIDAELMFVGEAPGADEDVQGEPFVGAAGQLLTKIIQTMGLSRQSVYIANILKCRPDTPGQRSGNRKPTADEMKTCLPYLQAQIDLIQPRVMVALGATAVEGLLGKTVGITRLRGHWQTYREIPLMPTYHPAYLLRNQARSERRKVWEDMLQVMERLGMPMTEKQRNYFLS